MNYTTQDIILLKYSFHFRKPLNNTSDVTMWQVVLIWFPFWENDLCLAPGLRMPVAFHLSELTLLSRGFHQFLILSQKKSYIRSHNQYKICRPLSDTVLSGFRFCQFICFDWRGPPLPTKRDFLFKGVHQISEWTCRFHFRQPKQWQLIVHLRSKILLTLLHPLTLL